MKEYLWFGCFYRKSRMEIVENVCVFVLNLLWCLEKRKIKMEKILHVAKILIQLWCITFCCCCFCGCSARGANKWNLKFIQWNRIFQEIDLILLLLFTLFVCFRSIYWISAPFPLMQTMFMTVVLRVAREQLVLRGNGIKESVE